MAANKNNNTSKGSKNTAWVKAEALLAMGNYAEARRAFVAIENEHGEGDLAQAAVRERQLLDVDSGALLAAGIFLTVYGLLWLVVLN